MSNLHRLLAMLLAIVLAAVACKGSAPGDRCARCGMKIAQGSAWTAQVDARRFDTPRCALSTWLADGKKGDVRVQDYYDRAWHPASDVRFVVGSDVVGPMGPELVPVDAARVEKFEKDHGGKRALALAEIDEASLAP
ncbi:MAG TPA: nitrous oxide reductase accessory protein NosL [Polyangiaceae bacterium]|nr:nitrous oxide reductase accessory protein NosL [Polyangiaceae bacterium]